MPLIELRGITRSYLVGGQELRVLKGIDLSIEEGEFVAIMGPSGSGKSTLMQILGLLDRPSSGTYLLAGRDVSKLSDDEGAALRSRTIGFIFQMFNLLARTSALENVELPMVYSGAPRRRERAAELLREVGLGERMEHRPNELSGGQQQRVAIARALANRPRILFADEPTGNLASDQAEEILARLQLLNDAGITIIMVTHAPEIAEHAKRIVRIKDGAVLSDESIRQSSGLSDGGVTAQGGTAAAPRVSPTTASRASPPAPAASLAPPRMRWGELREYGSSALRAMAANKVRSALSMLGILIGVAAVIAMLAVGRGAQKAVEARLSSLGSNLLMLMPGAPNSGGVRGAGGGSGGSFSRLTLEDVKAIEKLGGRILRVDGSVQGGGQVVYQDKNTSTQVTGATALYERMRASTPYYGRFFTEQEDALRSRVALLGSTVVKNLFGEENPVGKTLKINRIGFTVIGVLPLKGATGFRDQDDFVLIPLQTAMKRVLGSKYLNNISIECDGAESMPGVMRDIETLMRQRHHLPAYKENDFQLRNMADIQAALAGTTQTFTLLLGIVAAISLLVGGIGIMNIMLVSVSERTREIGLRKAVGAARRAILAQFLIEAAVLATLGGVLGILLGAGVSFGLSRFAGWAAEVTPQSAFLAFTFSAGVGMVFGFWPARKASLLSPIEALRYE